MNITEQRLLEIILEEIKLMEAFLRRQRTKVTDPIDDDEIKDFVRASNLVRMSRLNKRVTNENLNENIKDRIRALVKREGGDENAIKKVSRSLGIPAVLVASMVAGAMACRRSEYVCWR